MKIHQETLRAVLLDQQADLGALTAHCVERAKSDELRGFLGSRLIKVVTGVRRAGKSTLCLSVLPIERIAYVNFDDERLVSLDTEGLNDIYETLLRIKPEAEAFVFDEIQNVPHWELFINRLQRKKRNILVTGSNGSLLSHDLASHLTGRQLSLELMPFSFSEFLRMKGLIAPQSQYQSTTPVQTPKDETTETRALLAGAFEDYFFKGGFPEVIRGEPQGPYLRELFDKIIGRDIAQRYELRGIKPLKELGLYLIQNSACQISLNNLCRVFSLRSLNTIRQYVEYLQDSYLLYELTGYSNKLRERSTQPKKIYACDTGLIAALDSKPTPDWGQRLETIVFLHLRRRFPQQLYYWKSQKHEVDFAIVEDRRITRLVQVCYSLSSERTRKREIAALVAACERHQLKQAQIITWSERAQLRVQLGESGGLTIDVLPAWQFCRDFA